MKTSAMILCSPWGWPRLSRPALNAAQLLPLPNHASLLSLSQVLTPRASLLDMCTLYSFSYVFPEETNLQHPIISPVKTTLGQYYHHKLYIWSLESMQLWNAGSFLPDGAPSLCHKPFGFPQMSQAPALWIPQMQGIDLAYLSVGPMDAPLTGTGVRVSVVQPDSWG